MKKGDYIWILCLLAWVLILIVPQSRVVFEKVTGEHVYMGSFVKFAILATMGELLGIRLSNGDWKKPAALPIRVIIWGVVGLAVALVFTVYSGGVAAAQAKALLPGEGNKFLSALFASTIMNLTFGPMLFAVHKLSDIFLDLKFGEKTEATLFKVVGRMDFQTLVKTTWLTYCIFFWIPAHTFVFMLPPNYRIIVSAFLSIALGLIASIAKKKLTRA